MEECSCLARAFAANRWRKMRDPYSLLGVKRDAGADEIKAAWRSKAKSLHPDHNQDDPNAAKRFTEVGQAYDLLKDPERRRRFDQSFDTQQTIMQQREAARQAEERAKAARARAEAVMEELARANAQRAQAQAQQQAQNQNQAGAASEPAEDMVERIFGSGAQRAAAGGGGSYRAQQQSTAQGSQHPGQQSAGQQSSGPKPNAQQQAQASSGARASDPSQDQASKAEPDEKPEAPKPATPLPLQAIELISTLVRRIRGEVPPPEKAPDLTVTASVSLEDLLELKPSQVTLSDEREVRFALEPGMSDGHVLRLKGQGLRLPNMQRGDLVVTLQVRKDNRFRLEEFDLHTVLPIKLEDAVLGGEAEVETPGGIVPVSIPAWTGSDQTARLEGLGLQKEDGSRGDLVVEFRVLLWEKPDDKVIDLMRHMRYGLFV